MDSRASCDECPLKGRPITRPSGPPPEEAVAVIVGEAPGKTEAQEGVPFVGEAGYLLHQVADYVGLDMSKVYLTNVAMCHPPNNKLPPAAVRCCQDRLKRELKPYFEVGVPVGAAGATATNILTGHEKIGKVRCRWQDNEILPMWHPAYILRSPNRLSEFVADMRKLARGKPLRLKEPTYEVLTSLDKLTVRLAESNLIVCDIETDSLDYQTGKILSIGFATSSTTAYVIPSHLIYTAGTEVELRYHFSKPYVKFVGHNFKFDMRFLKHQLACHHVRVDYDTMIAHHALDENAGHGLKQLLFSYFDIDDYEQDLIKKHLGRSKDYSKVPLDALYEYNAKDVCYNFALWEVLERELKEEGLYERPFLDPMMRLNEPLLESELHGVYVDQDAFGPLQKRVHDTVNRLHTKLQRMAGCEFNYNSPQQVSRIMYDHFEMPLVSGRKFKEGSTAEGARIAIRQQIDSESDAYKWLDMYDELKKVEKMRSSYIDNLPKMLDEENRVHPEFKITGTEIGRLSAASPAIQTIPRPTTAAVGGVKWGKAVRSLFSAPAKRLLISADYSQAEWRCAAVCSGESYLINLYENDRDIHSEVAAGIYGDHFTDGQRSIVKNFTFSYLYGGSEYSFAKDAGMPLKRAREFVLRFNELMPVLAAWREQQFELMQEEGYVQTLTGRCRRFPLITSANQDDARKASIHFPVAGLAADIMNAAIIRLHEWLKSQPDLDAKLLFTVHDSAIFEAARRDEHTVAMGAKQIMEAVAAEIAPQVPWKVDVESGYSWGELKEYKF